MQTITVTILAAFVLTVLPAAWDSTTGAALRIHAAAERAAMTR